MHMKPSPDFLQDREEEAKSRIVNYLRGIGQSNVEKNAFELLSPDQFDGRFDFFAPRLDASAKKRLLISGCAIGSEHIAARKYGFREIHGTEITKELVEIAEYRFSDEDDFHFRLYDG